MRCAGPRKREPINYYVLAFEKYCRTSDFSAPSPYYSVSLPSQTEFLVMCLTTVFTLLLVVLIGSTAI